MNTYGTLALLAHDRDWDGQPWPFVPFVAILALVTIWFFVGRHWRGSPRVAGEAVLAERYARGEIDEAEYTARREVLRRRK